MGFGVFSQVSFIYVVLPLFFFALTYNRLTQQLQHFVRGRRLQRAFHRRHAILFTSYALRFRRTSLTLRLAPNTSGLLASYRQLAMTSFGLHHVKELTLLNGGVVTYRLIRRRNGRSTVRASKVTLILPTQHGVHYTFIIIGLRARVWPTKVVLTANGTPTMFIVVR